MATDSRTLPELVNKPGKTNCVITGCGKPVFAKGWCSAHYSRARRNGHPCGGRQRYGTTGCSEPGCDRPHHAGGLCRSHAAAKWRSEQGACSIAGCDEPIAGRGWCQVHYQRWKAYDDPLAGPPFRRPRGTGLPAWAYWQRRDEQRAAADSTLLGYVDILRGDVCSYCQVAPCEHIDHIEPVDAGGLLVVENVTAACGPCNRSKHAIPLLPFLLKRVVA